MEVIFEKRFKVVDIIKCDDEYSFWIISFANARQDLFLTNKNILRILSSDDNTELFYFVKMNIGHLNESLALLMKAFEDPIKEELIKISGLKEEYESLLELTNGTDKESFYKKVLSETRNNSFHYNKGWNERYKHDEFESYRKVLKSMGKENHFSGYKIGEKRGENNFYFAEEIQVNWFFELGKAYKLDDEALLERLAYITSKVIDILTLIVDDFLINRVGGNIGFTIRYRK